VRTITWIRNYCLIVFFIVMAGGVILKPGRTPAPSPDTTSPAAVQATAGATATG
jgi:hypothetical protein